MIIVIKANTRTNKIDEVIKEIQTLGYDPKVIHGEVQTVIAAIGDESKHASLEAFASWEQVESVIPIQKKYKLTSRESHGRDTKIKSVGQVIGGGEKFCFMAGPCSVESEKQIMETAYAVKEAGATFLRGGAFKPRTSPYEFQGLAKEGLKLLKKAKDETGLGIVTELLSEADVELVAEYADILQIGTRNAQNFGLLVAAAKTKKPVLLKRGMAMRMEEWLNAAEYILSNGNPNVILCERGIRTFENYTRNTLDLGAIAICKKESHLPVIIDPSQGCGRADLVVELCKGAAAMNADGLLIEVHPDPTKAWSDAAQQIDYKKFAQLVKDLTPFIQAVGRPAPESVLV
jgi:3-deoxy-7-phosphoheptulonate synthase